MTLKNWVTLRNHQKARKKKWQVQSKRNSLDPPCGEKLSGYPRKKKMFKVVGKTCMIPKASPTETVWQSSLPCEQLLLAARPQALASTRLSIWRYFKGWLFLLHHLRLWVHYYVPLDYFVMIHTKWGLYWDYNFLTFAVSWYFGISPFIRYVLAVLVWPRTVIVFILPFSLPMNSRVLGKTSKSLAQHTHDL